MKLLNTYRLSAIHVKAVFNYMNYGYYFNPYSSKRLTKSLFNREYYTDSLLKRTRGTKWQYYQCLLLILDNLREYLITVMMDIIIVNQYLDYIEGVISGHII